MLKISRLVLCGDKPYENVQLMLPGEMDDSEVAGILGDEKTVVFNQIGSRHQAKWFYAHAQNVSMMIVDSLVKHGGSGAVFERIVLGNNVYGPGKLVNPEDFDAVGITQDLLDLKIFDEPLVFIVSEGLCITNAGTVATLEALALAPKAKPQEVVPATNEPLVQPEEPAKQFIDPAELKTPEAPKTTVEVKKEEVKPVEVKKEEPKKEEAKPAPAAPTKPAEPLKPVEVKKEEPKKEEVKPAPAAPAKPAETLKPTHSPTPTPEPVKVDPAPGQEVKVEPHK